ncbi:3-oxoacyl-[acyl-carrier-protein] synthase III [Chitinophaga costaii]|uniref:Beta-ketoacyl-[acyl-carrier-protein] synthase III n=1 Tax=Chitinophaga costaii TaxID=1335309 RepID=A0A1C4BWE8_9BACT|nr:beta-ketoacyl-ACP synthase III [Chitinophaga costaii]PUZ27447.1 ketoacyl-ACP synthase III [Chitinophaga costaii]SCC11063.1 3-oxoacyl-[acyl-carrier-protein] synthase III [Chitinophaga costaii]
MSKITAAITAVGGYVPDYVLTNQELEKIIDTTDEWITSRTGIKERRILKGEGKGTSDLCVPVAQQILEKKGLQADDIDLIIVATVTPDMVFPATANILADKIGATKAFGFDIGAACSGFLYALDTGARFIESGRYKRVMVIGADKMSAIVDYTDRATCIIFGDGAGGVLLEPSTEGYGLIDSILKSDGHGRLYLHMKAGGSVKPASIETVTNREHYVYQEGKMVFKYAVSNMAEAAYELMQRNHLRPEDIAFLVPHQANRRIIDATALRMGLPEEKVMINIDHFGNTTAATIPLCLWEYEKKLKKGDNLVLAAFGGGFTWGSSFIKWAYDGK